MEWKFAAIISKFPEQELAIRRLYSRNAGFMGACDDYGVAAITLRHWERARTKYTTRADEYRHMLGELEAEILEGLDTQRLRDCQHGD